jgi:hypothetical protein
MFLKPLGLAAVIAAGFGLGATRLKVRPRAAVLTVIVAVVTHAIVKWALPHEAIEQLAEAHLFDAGGLVLVPIAMVETAGLWIPVALFPWSDTTSRVWATVYLLAAAMLAAAVYYFPFDVHMINGEILGPKHPNYELHLVPPLLFAGVGYIFGLRKRRRSARMKAAGTQ